MKNKIFKKITEVNPEQISESEAYEIGGSMKKAFEILKGHPRVVQPSSKIRNVDNRDFYCSCHIDNILYVFQVFPKPPYNHTPPILYIVDLIKEQCFKIKPNGLDNLNNLLNSKMIDKI